MSRFITSLSIGSVLYNHVLGQNFVFVTSRCAVPDCDERRCLPPRPAPYVFLSQGQTIPSCSQYDSLIQARITGFSNDVSHPSSFTEEFCGQTVDFYERNPGDHVSYEFYIHNGDGVARGTCFAAQNSQQTCGNNIGQCSGGASFACYYNGAQYDFCNPPQTTTQAPPPPPPPPSSSTSIPPPSPIVRCDEKRTMEKPSRSELKSVWTESENAVCGGKLTNEAKHTLKEDYEFTTFSTPGTDVKKYCKSDTSRIISQCVDSEGFYGGNITRDVPEGQILFVISDTAYPKPPFDKPSESSTHHPTTSSRQSTKHTAASEHHSTTSTHRSSTSEHHTSTSSHHSSALTYHSDTSTHHSGTSTHHSGTSTHHSGTSTHHSGTSTRRSSTSRYDSSRSSYDSAAPTSFLTKTHTQSRSSTKTSSTVHPSASSVTYDELLALIQKIKIDLQDLQESAIAWRDSLHSGSRARRVRRDATSLPKFKAFKSKAKRIRTEFRRADTEVAEAIELHEISQSRRAEYQRLHDEFDTIERGVDTWTFGDVAAAGAAVTAAGTVLALFGVFIGHVISDHNGPGGGGLSVTIIGFPTTVTTIKTGTSSRSKTSSSSSSSSSKSACPLPTGSRQYPFDDEADAGGLDHYFGSDENIGSGNEKRDLLLARTPLGEDNRSDGSEAFLSGNESSSMLVKRRSTDYTPDNVKLPVFEIQGPDYWTAAQCINPKAKDQVDWLKTEVSKFFVITTDPSDDGGCSVWNLKQISSEVDVVKLDNPTPNKQGQRVKYAYVGNDQGINVEHVYELSFVKKFFEDETSSFNGAETTKWQNFWGGVNEESKSYNWELGKSKIVQGRAKVYDPVSGSSDKQFLQDVGWNRFQTIVSLLPSKLRKGNADFVLMDSQVNGAKADLFGAGVPGIVAEKDDVKDQIARFKYQVLAVDALRLDSVAEKFKNTNWRMYRAYQQIDAHAETDHPENKPNDNYAGRYSSWMEEFLSTQGTQVSSAISRVAAASIMPRVADDAALSKDFDAFLQAHPTAGIGFDVPKLVDWPAADTNPDPRINRRAAAGQAATAAETPAPTAAVRFL